jgi:hypothetical protein
MRVSCDFSFQDTRYHQMTQVIRWSKYGCLVVTGGFRSGVARLSLEHVLTCWHRPLSWLLVVLPRHLR